jgi:hypothetical protein
VITHFSTTPATLVFDGKISTIAITDACQTWAFAFTFLTPLEVNDVVREGDWPWILRLSGPVILLETPEPLELSIAFSLFKLIDGELFERFSRGGFIVSTTLLSLSEHEP